MMITDRQKIIEVAAVIITALLKIIFMDFLNWRLPFIVVAIMGWLSYVIYQKNRNPGILQRWGFRIDNFTRVVRMIFPFGIAAVMAFFALGAYFNTLNMTWHIFPILVLYPVWGTIQQFLVISLVAGNLQDIKSFQLNRIVVILTTATLFALVHYPYYWLMVGTFFLAILYGIVFLKERNVFVLGLFHGWLGGLFFYTVVDRDPFEEVFGRFLQQL
jgi:hypothetical protein